jgi:heptosyltransferase-3
MKTIAIFPSKGIGDALLMMISAYSHHQNECKVTVYHDQYKSLQKLFPYCIFKNRSNLIPKKELFSYDRLLLQYDNSEFAKKLVLLRNKDSLNLFILYPTYQQKKHTPLTAKDFVCKRKPIAHNISDACIELFSHELNNEIGLDIPSNLTKNKYPKRIVIHPSSSDKKKNWNPKKFIFLAQKLRSKGFNPVFCVSPSERKEWLFVQKYNFDLPLFPTFFDLSCFLYETKYFIGNESGPGHLASYLKMPSTIIASDPKHMKLWRPGWFNNSVVFPPNWTPNIKFLRLRANYWQNFISTNKVLSTFLDNL